MKPQTTKELPLKMINKKIQRLIERDGGQCWICGFDVVLVQGKMHPLRPTRDHVIAMKDGGKELHNNIRLAHAYCNERRHWDDVIYSPYQAYQTKRFFECLGEIQ